MSIVVPIKRREPISNDAPPPQTPPDPNYLLMAAAQMHSEGRLIQKPNGNK